MMIFLLALSMMVAMAASAIVLLLEENEANAYVPPLLV
jgi:hypothetical protein